MSDTPRTDAVFPFVKECLNDGTRMIYRYQSEQVSLCQELERENAALREKLEDPARLHAHCVRYLTDAQVSHLFGERMTAIQNDRNRLEAENAALKQALDAQMQYQRELRADRDRLDWLITTASVDQMIVLTSNPTEARKTIDSAMGVSSS